MLKLSSIAVACSLVLAGCQSNPSVTSLDALPYKSSPTLNLPVQIDVTADSEPKRLVGAALKNISDGELRKASANLNAALRLDYANSNIQLLNGITYHLMAAGGDRSAVDLASEAYKAAISFDPSNWVASYYMGVLGLEQKKYDVATKYLSDYVAQYDTDSEALYYLASASYLNGDAPNAAIFAKRAKDVFTVAHGKGVSLAEINRLFAITQAAIGNQDTAEQALVSIEGEHANKFLIERTQKRIQSLVKDSPYSVQKVNNPYDPYSASNSSSNPYSSGSSGQDYSYNGGYGSYGYDSYGSDLKSGSTDMVAVDVVIVRTSDSASSSQGINLLNGLQLQFGDRMNGLPAFSSNTNNYKDLIDPTLSTNTKTITRVITVPALTYSMNIVNSRDGNNRILAQPTLVSRVGRTSEFFAGMAVSAAAVSSGAGDSVLIEKEVGVRLAITPDISEDGTVLLAVNAEKTYLTNPSSSIVFQYRLDTTKTQVNANVAMQFGQTLILSGLSESDKENIDDGVPVLKDIPIVNLAFSNKVERESKSSVMILLTPRKADFADSKKTLDELMESKVKFNKSSEMYKKFASWYQADENHVVPVSFTRDSFYRTFQTSDVTLVPWYLSSKNVDRLSSTLGNIYSY